MRLLIVPLAGGEGLGPLTRCLAVAHEAAFRHHEIAFLCRREFGDIVKRLGYVTFELRQPKPSGLVRPQYRLADAAVELGWLDIDYLEETILIERDIIRAFRPDIVLTELQLTAPVSAAIEGIPVAAVASWADHPNFRSPLYDPSVRSIGLEEGVNRILVRCGLPVIHDICELGFLTANVKIAPTTPELQPELSDLPSVEFVGYLLANEFEQGPLPEDLLDWLPGGPVAYVYMSPGEIRPEQWIPTIVRSFQHSPWKVIVSLAPLRLSSDALPQVDNVRFFNMLPGRTTIERSDVVITHGGGNTLAGAMLSGKPVLVFADTYAERDYNGRAIERLGGGLNLPTEEFTPEKVRCCAERLVSEHTCRNGAMQIGRRMREFGGSARAVDVLEQYLVRGSA